MLVFFFFFFFQAEDGIRDKLVTGVQTCALPISPAANRWVRGALVSAIPSHVRYAPTSPVTVAYEQLKARLGWRVARVAAARKLARVVYVMLTRRTPWHGVPAAGDVRDEVQNSHVAPTTSFC